MKRAILFTVLGMVVLCAGVASADSHERYVVIWKCTLNDGQSMDDVNATNSKWVELMNAKIEGGDVHSYVLTPIVGEQGGFMYVDSFPSLTAWQAVGGVMESDEGKALEESFDTLADCEKNSLHKATAS